MKYIRHIYKTNIKHNSRIYHTICTYNDNVPISPHDFSQPTILTARRIGLSGQALSLVCQGAGRDGVWRRELGVKGGISIGIAIKWLFDYI